MEIHNTSTTPSKSSQLKNVYTVRWESRNITTQSNKIDARTIEVITLVVNAGMNKTANNFYISFFVWSICFVQLKFCKIYIKNMFLKFRVFIILCK